MPLGIFFSVFFWPARLGSRQYLVFLIPTILRYGMTGSTVTLLPVFVFYAISSLLIFSAFRFCFLKISQIKDRLIGDYVNFKNNR